MQRIVLQTPGMLFKVPGLPQACETALPLRPAMGQPQDFSILILHAMAWLLHNVMFLYTGSDGIKRLKDGNTSQCRNSPHAVTLGQAASTLGWVGGDKALDMLYLSYYELLLWL